MQQLCVLQFWELVGFEPEQLPSAEAAPSERSQATLLVRVPPPQVSEQLPQFPVTQP
jgi:hypothetical protein